MVSSRGQRTERLVLKFGLVDHMYYLKPSMEQLNRFKECVEQQYLVFEIQKKLCPFVSLAGTGLNFNLMAEVFYRVYQPQRIRELQLPVKARAGCSPSSASVVCRSRWPRSSASFR